MSEFWKRKLRTYFSKFDFDSDGVVSENDMVEMALRFANFEKADKGKAEHLKTIFENVWEQFMKKAVTGDMKGMTVDVFIDSIGKQRYDPELMKHYSSQIHGLFNLMDVNCDGYLQEDEYHRMLVQLGVQDASFAKEAFNAIDVNGDGKLSIVEFVNAFFDFLFSEDEKSPKAFFFGPLVD